MMGYAGWRGGSGVLRVEAFTPLDAAEIPP